MKVLGIETSCDETGIALYDSRQGLLAHQTYSQISAHQAFGGVVPELASRDHLRKLLPMIASLLTDSKPDAIAYTKGPGLHGALLVGAMAARTLGFAWDIPVIGIHHLEGHLLAPCLEENPPQYPFLALLVSGGHTQLISVAKIGAYTLLGDTLDDAVGEAFDKTAKLLGLAYPGGAALAQLATFGDPKRFHFPRPMIDRPGLDFSFSGLKTFALRTVEKVTLDEQTKADIARAFEETIADVMRIKCKRALQQTGLKSLVVAGGVGANLRLRQVLQTLGTQLQVKVYFPRLEFCSDNGAMIAYAGCKRLLAGFCDDLSVDVKARINLESLTPIN